MYQVSPIFKSRSSGELFFYVTHVAPYSELHHTLLKDSLYINIPATGSISGMVTFSLAKTRNRTVLIHNLEEYMVIYQSVLDGIRYTTANDSFAKRFEPV